MSPVRRWLLAASALAAGCTLVVEADPLADGGLSQSLTVRGRVCTSQPPATPFPVKVVLLVDNSGSLCITDGPGAQPGGGLCELAAAQLAAAGVTTPGRVLAIQKLLEKLASEGNAEVALVPFDTTTHPFPAAGFVSPSDAELARHVADLGKNLGKASDFQGALAEAHHRIAQDIAAQRSAGRQALLPRSRYVVVMLSDSAPYPRCAANDSLAPQDWASAESPAGIWADEPPAFCNGSESAEGGNPECLGMQCEGGSGVVSTIVPGFVYGGDRNQNTQLFDAIGRLRTLAQKENVGEIRLDTVLLFDETLVSNSCGALCVQDLFKGSTTDFHRIAGWTLEQMAEAHGGGTFQEFARASLIDLTRLDYSSFDARPSMKTLRARNAPQAEGAWDSDGDGLSDEREAELKTNPASSDSDGDGLPDSFEVENGELGYDPLAIDRYGCKPGAGVLVSYSCEDSDGDGLSQAMERLAGTDESLADSDHDGVVDGLERLIRAEEPDTCRYEMLPGTQSGGGECYDFTVNAIPWLAVASEGAGTAANVVFVDFAEAPEGVKANDHGQWRRACVVARSPGEVVLQDSDFLPLEEMAPPSGAVLPTAWQTVCRQR